MKIEVEINNTPEVWEPIKPIWDHCVGVTAEGGWWVFRNKERMLLVKKHESPGHFYYRGSVDGSEERTEGSDHNSKFLRDWLGRRDREDEILINGMRASAWVVVAMDAINRGWTPGNGDVYRHERLIAEKDLERAHRLVINQGIHGGAAGS